METIAMLIVGVGTIALLLGLIGSMFPMLPGPPLSAAGNLILQIGLTVDSGISVVGWTLSIISVALGILMTVADFITPGIVAVFGGSGKRAARYAMVGVILAFILSCCGGGPVTMITGGLGLPPSVVVGMILLFAGAFLGGTLGELEDIPRDEPNRNKKAMRAGFTHMIGLSLSMLVKVGYGIFAMVIAGLQVLVQYL